MSNINTNVNTIDYNGSTYNVKYILPLPEMMGFIDDVSSSCFDADDMSYMPEVKDFAIRVETFELYTDVKLPEDINEKYVYVYENDVLFRTVISHVSHAQFDAILNAIDQKIEHAVNTHIESVNTFVSGIASKVESLEKQLSQLFSQVNEEDIKKVFSVLADYDANALGLAQKSFEKKRE